VRKANTPAEPRFLLHRRSQPRKRAVARGTESLPFEVGLVLHLTPDCLDTWLKEYDTFKYAFLRYQNFVVQSIGYSIAPDFQVCSRHTAWCERCRECRAAGWSIRQGSVAAQGAGAPPARAVRSLVDQGDSRVRRGTGPAAFRRTEDEKEELRRDIAGGQGTYLAFEFVTS